MKKILTIFIVFISTVMISNAATYGSPETMLEKTRITTKYCSSEDFKIICSPKYSIECKTRDNINIDEMMVDIKNICSLMAEENKIVSKPITNSTEKKQDLVDKNEKIVSSESLDTKTEDKQNILQRTGNTIGGGIKSVGNKIGNTFKSDKKKLAEATQGATDTEKQALEEFNNSVQIAKSEFERKIGI